MESYQVNQSQHPLFNQDLSKNLINKNQPIFNFGIDHPVAKMQKDYFKKEESTSKGLSFPRKSLNSILS